HLRQQIIDSFSLSDVPGDKRNLRAAGSQLSRQEASRDFNLLVFFRIRVKRDDHAAAFPNNDVEVGDHASDVAPVAVRPSRLAYRATPVPNASQPDRQESGRN